MTKRREIWARMDEVLPFVAMLIITCLDISLLIIVKAAMNGGMKSIVYVVYHNAVATLILLPFFIIHIYKNKDTGRLPLTFHILFRFFILGLLGLCLYEVFAYLGVSYSSPTMASAISNLTPGITFLLAVVFRMEKIDIRSLSSGAKLLGTIIALSGAMVLTFYQGPEIFQPIPSLNYSPNQLLWSQPSNWVPIPSLNYSPNQLLLSQPSNWVFGGLIIFMGAIFGCIWNVLQTTTVREYPDQQTIVFFMSLFGTLQCIALSPFIEPRPSAWVLQPGIGMIAVVFGAVHSTVFRCTVVIWCLRKKGPVFVTMFSPLSIVIAVTMGIAFLGDSLYLGSAIGAMIVYAGFYTVMWGQAKEENKLNVVMEEKDVVAVPDELGSSDQTTPLLSSRNDSKC